MNLYEWLWKIYGNKIVSILPKIKKQSNFDEFNLILWDCEILLDWFKALQRIIFQLWVQAATNWESIIIFEIIVMNRNVLVNERA